MMTKSSNNDRLLRGTGLLVIEVRNSNPNGDPDRESDPRCRPDRRGEISPVSFKRKLRDSVQREIDGDRPCVWQEVSTQMGGLSDDEFCILETRGRKREEIKALTKEDFIRKYWDARLFGCTFLEEGTRYIKTGVAQFGMGVSIAPIEIRRQTNTNKPGVEEGTEQGMAPLAYRFVEHGLYLMPFTVNPNLANQSGCEKRDVDLMLALIRHAYPCNPSAIRPGVEVKHAWYMEHKSPLGSCSDFALIDAMTPKRKPQFDSSKPSKSWDEYEIPTQLPENLRNRIRGIWDVVNEKWSPNE